MNPRGVAYYFNLGLAMPDTMRLGQFSLTPQLPVDIGGGIKI